MPAPKAPDLLQRLRENAWIGDAVLELYVRSHILREHGRVDAEMKTRFTCNQFLSCHGNPTAVEAEIGVIYQREGQEAAFAWIRDNLEPLFVKQEAKRKRTGKQFP
ncbi:MAG: ribonuclease III domain-containing protein [Prosthecobacter sp.]